MPQCFWLAIITIIIPLQLSQAWMWSIAKTWTQFINWLL